jgi:hypothetical protein
MNARKTRTATMHARSKQTSPVDAFMQALNRMRTPAAREREQKRQDAVIAEAKRILRSRGGQARAKALTSTRRREIARLGGLAKAKGEHYSTRGYLTMAGLNAEAPRMVGQPTRKTTKPTKEEGAR